MQQALMGSCFLNKGSARAGEPKALGSALAQTF